MTSFARLNASLLAQKGEAIPAMRWSANDSFASKSSSGQMKDTAHSGKPELSSTAPAQKTTHRLELQKNGTRKTEKKGRKEKVTDEKRIALTLRLDKERHLSLRLLAAHLNTSGQDLMIEALDALLDDYAKRTSNCACLESGSPASQKNSGARACCKDQGLDR